MYNTGSETGLLATCRIATYHGALLHVSQDFNGKLIPLLVKEGWPRHQKMVPFRKGADGVVARESRFATRLDTLRVSDHPVCGASVASRCFINAAAIPPLQGGECAVFNTPARQDFF